MREEIPVEVWLPLFVITTAVYLFRTRATWLALLGFKEKK